MFNLKKCVLAIAILLVVGMAVALLFFLNASAGSASGIIQLFVDGEDVRIDGTVVEFSFTTYKG